MHCFQMCITLGAGDGDRTHTTSLEGWGSTIELHPHTLRLANVFLGGQGWCVFNVPRCVCLFLALFLNVRKT